MTQASTLLSPRSQQLFPDPDRARLLEAARTHPAVFIDCFCHCYDASSRTDFPFHLWDWQWELLALWLNHRRVVVLKARQLGASWLAAGYALWTALFHPNVNVLLISRTEDVAKQLLSKCSYMYDRLPPELKPGYHQRDSFATAVMSWGSLNSKIQALASTRESGRSESSSLVIADEWADHPYAGEMFSSYEPTTGTEGQIIGISTAKGRRGLFYHTYLSAKQGRGNDFFACFLSARLHPLYTDEFLAAKKRTFETIGEPWKFEQEFCISDVAAFGGSLRTYFPMDALERLSAGIRPPTKVHHDAPWYGNLSLWDSPHLGHRYVIGADPADLGPDSSAAAVIHAPTGRHVATLASPSYSPYEFAHLLHLLGRMYAADPATPASVPVLAVERNNHGIAVIEALQNVWEYPNLYRGKDVRGKGHLGWLTNTNTRHVMLSEFRQAIADGGFFTEDADLIEEFSTFEEDEHGRPGAAHAAHDDRVFASGIGWMARLQFPAVRQSRRTPALSR